MTWPSRLALFTGAFLALVSGSGCASRARVRAQTEEIEQLKRQLAAVQREQAEQRAQAEQVRNQLFILHDRLETTQTRLSWTTQAPPKLEVVKLVPPAHSDPLEAKIRVARPAAAPDPVDVEAYDPSADEAEMFSFGDDDVAAAPAHATPLPRVSPAEGVARSAVRAPVPEALARTSTAAPKEEPMALYQRAFALFQQRNFGDATLAFEEFVRANPAHEYADNAYYWMGECYYGQGEYALAIGEFQKVPELYPGGNKVPDALLKIGLSYQNLNNPRSAEKMLRQLVDAYPQSEAARIGKQRLAKMQP